MPVLKVDLPFVFVFTCVCFIDPFSAPRLFLGSCYALINISTLYWSSRGRCTHGVEDQARCEPRKMPDPLLRWHISMCTWHCREQYQRRRLFRLRLLAFCPTHLNLHGAMLPLYISACSVSVLRCVLSKRQTRAGARFTPTHRSAAPPTPYSLFPQHAGVLAPVPAFHVFVCYECLNLLAWIGWPAGVGRQGLRGDQAVDGHRLRGPGQPGVLQGMYSSS